MLVKNDINFIPIQRKMRQFDIEHLAHNTSKINRNNGLCARLSFVQLGTDNSGNIVRNKSGSTFL